MLLHVLGVFVGAGQLRNIDAIEEEAGVDARRFFGENFLIGLADFAALVPGAAQVAARAVRGKAQVAGRGVAFHDEDGLGHVERNDARAGDVGHEFGVERRGSLGVVKHIAVAKHEVVLVPVALLRGRFQLGGNGLVQHFVVALGPLAHGLQGAPVVHALGGFAGNPGVGGGSFGRDVAAEKLSYFHAVAIEHGPHAARAVVGHEHGVAGILGDADIQKVVAVALRAEVLAGHFQAALGVQKRVGLHLGLNLGGQRKLLVGIAAAGAKMGDSLRSIEHRFGVNFTQIGQHHRAADVGRMHAGMDGVARGHHAAYRNGAQRPSRAGVGHDGTVHDSGRAHQQLHRLPHVVDVGLFHGRIGPDIFIKTHRGGQQRNDWRGLHRVEVGVQGLAFKGLGIDVRQRFFEPFAGLQAQIE